MQSQAPSAAAPSDQLKASLQNPAALQRVWQAVLATLKKNKAAYGVLFLNTKAVYDAGKDTLIIEFPAENSFAFKAVQKPDVQEAVSVALNQACGESLHFAYAQGGAVATAAAPAARPAPTSASAPSPTPRPTPVTSRPRRRPRLLRIRLRRRRLLPPRLPCRLRLLRLRLRWMLVRRRRPSLRCSNRPKSCRPFWPPVSAMACASKK